MIRLMLILIAGLSGPSLASAFPVEIAPEPIQAASPFAPSQESGEREPGPANLDEAIEIAESRYGGQPAGAETVVRDGRRVHEVKLLGEDGSVRTVWIDPRTGAIIQPRR